MALALFAGVLLLAVALGVPVAFSLILAGISLMLHLDLFNPDIIAQNMINGADNFVLMAIPFFLLAGELMNYGGLSRRIVHLGMAAIGHLRGGLGYVAIIAALLMASLSGSAVADTAAICAVLIPMMRSAGYDEKRASGLIAAGGIIAPIIPPSIGFIVFGVAAGVSITQLFMAGIAPGLLMGVALTTIWAIVSRREAAEPLPRQSFSAVARSALEGFWALLMPIIIIGGLRFGIFTPTEAGVVAAVYAFFVGSFIYRELSLDGLFTSLVSAAKTSAAIMFLLASAFVGAWLITVSGIQAIVMSLASSLVEYPRLLLLVIVFVVLVLGTALDFTPTILILTPVLMPLVKAAGINPVYFGVIFMISAAIGMITPPVGTVLNAAGAASGIKFEDVVKGVAPFLLGHVMILLLLIAFPDLVLVPLRWITLAN